MIATKREFLALWHSGRLGNKPRVWSRIEDAAGYAGTFSVRDGRPNSNLSRYNVPRDGLEQAVAEMTALGGRDLHFNESAPDHRLILQGEYQDSFPRNKYLMWSAEKTQMKRVKRWQHCESSASRVLLRSVMDGNSLDDFDGLIERYPDHIVEFGVYDCFVGDLPGRNTIIWEVRGTY